MLRGAFEGKRLLVARAVAFRVLEFVRDVVGGAKLIHYLADVVLGEGLVMMSEDDIYVAAERLASAVAAYDDHLEAGVDIVRVREDGGCDAFDF